MKMTVTRKIESEVDVVAIRCAVAVRYDEDDMPNDYPHRKGEMWDVTIDIETGQIRDWPNGVEPRDLYMKVCDQGNYWLLGPTGEIVAGREDNYVPSCIPQKYGDYITFDIDAAGRITNWKFDEDAAQRIFIGVDDE